MDVVDGSETLTPTHPTCSSPTLEWFYLSKNKNRFTRREAKYEKKRALLEKCRGTIFKVAVRRHHQTTSLSGKISGKLKTNILGAVRSTRNVVKIPAHQNYLVKTLCC